MILRNTVLDSSYSQVSQTMLGFFGALRETHFLFKSGVIKQNAMENLWHHGTRSVGRYLPLYYFISNL